MTDEAAGLMDDQPFWQFSTALYSDGEVERACLALQDEKGFDVNLLLLCVWLGARGVSLRGESMDLLVAQSNAWRLQAVLPLRQLRQSLKAPVEGVNRRHAETVRQEIKRLELATEKLQQDMLYTMLETLPGKDGRQADRAGVIRGNLSRYAKACAVSPSAAERARFEMLIQKAIGEQE